MRNISLLTLYETRKSSLSFGCPLLDEVIGGISRGIVTELCGEAGSGKTQICLKLSIQVQLPQELGGLGGKVTYLSCGEGELPLQRLSQLAERAEINTGITKFDFLNNILIEKIHNIDDLMESLSKTLPKLCTENNIKLIIIDSLAGIIRTEYNPLETDEMIIRSEIYFQLSQRLKWLAHTHSLCIVIVNQVTSMVHDINSYSAHSNGLLNSLHAYHDIDEGEYEKASNDNTSRFVLNSNDTMNMISIYPTYDRDMRILPSLGLAWAHCINTRIMLYRDTTHMRTVSLANSLDDSMIEGKNETLERIETVQNTSIRRICLQISPKLPKRECQFVITAAGVYGV